MIEKRPDRKKLNPRDGVCLCPSLLTPCEQSALLKDIDRIVAQGPYFQPTMPKSGRPFSVKMSNAGPLGWVSDKRGYRYEPLHPMTGQPWAPIPERLLDLWRDLTDYPDSPECCLINHYAHPKARMGLHQDRDEETFAAPVLSVSLGDSAIFRIGNLTRGGPTQSLKLTSGDVILLHGPGRLLFHGIDRVLFGSSQLVPGGGRINITLRRVSAPPG